MKLFGMGSVKEIFVSMRDRLAKIKEEMGYGELIIDDAVMASGNTPARITGKNDMGESVFQEKVIYLKWPLKPRMFVEMHPCRPDDLELKLKSGVYGGKLTEAPAPPEETDVLTIPDVERVPIIRPVMQEEKLMNVDIITERGIFIGLGAVQASFYLEKEGESKEEREAGDKNITPGYMPSEDNSFVPAGDPVFNSFSDMKSISVEQGVVGSFSRAPNIPGIAPAEIVSGIFDSSTDKESIYHEDADDGEIEKPEFSDVTSGISGKKYKKGKKK